MATLDGVEISPADLKFRFQLNKQLLGNINVNNTTDKRVAFKIKTTAPKKYVVRPSCGIAEVKSSVSVQVIMQAQKEYPTDFQNCKDKFMVQSVVLADGEDLDKDTFNKDVKKDGLKEARLRVVLEGPAAPPSPVPEASEHEQDDRSARGTPSGDLAPQSASRLKTAFNDLAATSQEVKTLKMQLDKITKDRDELRRTLDQVQLQRGGTGMLSGSKQESALKSKISIVHLILIAVVAFIIGHYVR